MFARQLVAALLVATIATACGKKGPPLPPIVHIPAGVDHLSARRVGNDVFLTLTVPATNIDKTMPADIGRIEVYGYTGTSQPPRARFLDVAAIVATVAVLPPPSDASPGTSASTESGTTQGGIVTVRDHLSADALVARPLPAPSAAAASKRAPVARVATTAKEGALRRFYLAIPFSPRGRPGPPGAFAELSLTATPDAPRDVIATVTADAIALSWEPSGGLIGYLFERAIPIESSPIDEPAAPESGSRSPGVETLPQGPTSYNVYREIEPAPDAPAPAPELSMVPLPVNGAPLGTLNFSEPVPLLDGRKRCYTVRAVRGTGPSAVEGESSVPACVTPTDDFPPAAPVGLSAASDAGAITLSWEPNSEADLAGYVVLRGEAGDATLAPLTGSVTTDARFVDNTVRPGVRYVYAVKAIDTHLPTPNVSAESVRVEETAR